MSGLPKNQTFGIPKSVFTSGYPFEMKRSDFHFDLPDECIARFPSQERDESRLMMVNRETGAISHHRFSDIAGLMSKREFLVINDTRVIPAKLFGKINGKPVEMLVVNIGDGVETEALALPAKRFKPGERVDIDNAPNVWAEVIDVGCRGRRTLRFNRSFQQVLSSGFAPLPPYIKRKQAEAIVYRQLDLERYQTVYAGKPGSIAAPTAGLHFTPEIMTHITQSHPLVRVTLEVGEATFQKIEVEDLAQHRMGRETITITQEARQRIRQFKQTGPLTAVGTTSVRSLETWALLDPEEETFYSELFISPGFEFNMTDKLITNFHLPESSLFILVSALAGVELMREAYRVAIAEGYRFFSYGDAMYIV